MPERIGKRAIRLEEKEVSGLGKRKRKRKFRGKLAGDSGFAPMQILQTVYAMRKRSHSLIECAEI